MLSSKNSKCIKQYGRSIALWVCDFIIYKVTTARSNQDSTLILHTYTHQSMSLPNINILHLMISEIEPGLDFLTAHPPTHPDAMGENNVHTACKGCGVKLFLFLFKSICKTINYFTCVWCSARFYTPHKMRGTDKKNLDKKNRPQNY